MFLNNKVIQVVKDQINQKNHRDFSKFEVPLFVRDDAGKYVKHYGRVGTAGFCYASNANTQVGDTIHVKIVLFGMGIVVETRGKVVSVTPHGKHREVAARFEKVSVEMSQKIARWLGLFSNAQRKVAVA